MYFGDDLKISRIFEVGARPACHNVSEGQVYDPRCLAIGKVLKDKYLVREAEKGCKE